jgi:pantoate--beta-alanine ligase
MEVFDSYESLKKVLNEGVGSIGMVPTMGALHEGHLSLIRRAVQENERVLISIFVNPTQFEEASDLINYPKTLAEDLKAIASIDSKIYVYVPKTNDIYGQNVLPETFDLSDLDQVMEGSKRKNHFQGVATIVKFFLETFKPTKAYFGQKDYQQLQIISHLAEKLNLNTEIIGCPIVREVDGLAMSSRNKHLTPAERKIAPLVFKALLEIKEMSKNKKYSVLKSFINAFFEEHSQLELDYFVIANSKTLLEISDQDKVREGRAFIAVRLGKIRLIDNLDLA